MKYKIYRCNCRKIWSIQNRKVKITSSSLLLIGIWTTELKPERKYNPKGFVTTTNGHNIIFNPGSKLMEQFEKVSKLIYDKENVHFNIKSGEFLFFAEDGSCFILKKAKRE